MAFTFLQSFFLSPSRKFLSFYLSLSLSDACAFSLTNPLPLILPPLLLTLYCCCCCCSSFESKTFAFVLFAFLWVRSRLTFFFTSSVFLFFFISIKIFTAFVKYSINSLLKTYVTLGCCFYIDWSSCLWKSISLRNKYSCYQWNFSLWSFSNSNFNTRINRSC